MTPTPNPTHYAHGRWAHRNSKGRFAPRPARVADTEAFFTETQNWDMGSGEVHRLVVHHIDPACVEIEDADHIRPATKSAVVKHGMFCATCCDEGSFAEIVANVAPAMADGHICTGCGEHHEDRAYPTTTIMGYRVRGRACRKAVKKGAQQSPYVVMFDLLGRVYDGTDPATPAQSVRDILTHFDALGREVMSAA